MFKIYDGREFFWQWDTNQRLIVDDQVCCEVHFCNKTGDCSLVCKVYVEDGIRLVNVPNILLQTDRSITAFAYVRGENGAYTRTAKIFMVRSRTKPSDYVYTETEVLNYQTLSARMRKLETDLETEVEEAVEEYLKENPPSEGVSFEVDNTLSLKDGVLSVNTTDQMEQDNTLPITSAGVYATVGNIEALLQTI